VHLQRLANSMMIPISKKKSMMISICMPFSSAMVGWGLVLVMTKMPIIVCTECQVVLTSLQGTMEDRSKFAHLLNEI
jgi:hypothetical protein